MDAVIRSGRILLIATLAACSPAKRELVGVSTGGAVQASAQSATSNPPLAGLPGDFRTTWTKAGSRVASEHGQFEADVYANPSACVETIRGKPLPSACRFVEDLYRRDAGAGIYLLAYGDAGARFGVADVHGRTVADDMWDGGGVALDACARCHAEAPRSGVFPVR